VSSVINLIPDGVVVFLPSYAFLARVKDIWQQKGLLDKLDARKKVGDHSKGRLERGTDLTAFPVVQSCSMNRNQAQMSNLFYETMRARSIT
jgi:hypothetical protein